MKVEERDGWLCVDGKCTKIRVDTEAKVIEITPVKKAESDLTAAERLACVREERFVAALVDAEGYRVRRKSP